MALKSSSVSPGGASSSSSLDKHRPHTRSDPHLMEKSLGNCEQLRIAPSNGMSPPSQRSLTPVASLAEPEPEARAAMASSPRARFTREQWYNIKLGLRVADIVNGVILMALAAALESMLAPGIIVATVAPAAGSGILWNVAEIVTLLVTKGEKGIVPGAHVALHLMIVLAWVACIPLLLLTGLVVLPGAYSYSYAIRYNNAYDSHYEGYDVISTGGANIALLLFIALNMVIQVTLFVISCRDEHLRRREEHATRALAAQVVAEQAAAAPARKGSFEEYP